MLRFHSSPRLRDLNSPARPEATSTSPWPRKRKEPFPEGRTFPSMGPTSWAVARASAPAEKRNAAMRNGVILAGRVARIDFPLFGERRRISAAAVDIAPRSILAPRCRVLLLL